MMPTYPQHRRRLRFSLRTLFVVVTAIALLMMHFPFVEQMPPSPPPDPSRSFADVDIDCPSFYRPPLKSGFLVTAGIEVVLAVGWLVSSWRRGSPASLFQDTTDEPFQ